MQSEHIITTVVEIFSSDTLIIRQKWKETRRVPHVEQELLTNQEHMRSSPVLVGYVLLKL